MNGSLQRSELTADEVATIVRPYLSQPILNGIQLQIREGKIRRVDGWWKVGVSPSRWPDRMYPLYEELAIIEEKLRDDNHLDILLSLGEPVETQ